MIALSVFLQQKHETGIANTHVARLTVVTENAISALRAVLFSSKVKLSDLLRLTDRLVWLVLYFVFRLPKENHSHIQKILMRKFCLDESKSLKL